MDLATCIRLLRRRRYYSGGRPLPEPTEGRWISYADHGEDILLKRCFPKPGFYIDAGANHPTHGSITKHFYDNGWQGINIEPVPEMFELLQKERPRDINICCALGAKAGEATFYKTAVSGYSTLNENFAKRAQAAGQKVHPYRVKIETLDKICSERRVQHIDFLKIDVEGAEKEVLLGFSFAPARPKVIVIEATKPDSREPSHEEWEALVFQANYTFAYFDGLNRFYVANQQKELLAHFKTPPNVWDKAIHHVAWRNSCELQKIFS